MKLANILAIPSLVSALTLNPFSLAGFAPSRTNETGAVEKRDSWAASISLGSSKTTITRAVTTLIHRSAPTIQNGMLFLRPGIPNGTGDLVQTTLESWGWTKWLVRREAWAVVYPQLSVRNRSFGQLVGKGSPVSENMKVEILYELLADGQTWKQTTTELGTKKQLSTFSRKSDPYMVR